MRLALVVALVLVLTAVAFGAGWFASEQWRDSESGACSSVSPEGVRQRPRVACSSEAAVSEYEEEQSVVCFPVFMAASQFSSGRGVYACSRRD